LVQISEEIEECLKDGKNLVTPQQKDELNKELNKALAEFEHQINETEQKLPVESEKSLDSEAILNLLGELEPMLKESDTDCMDLLDNLRLIPGSDTLVQQVEEFDFENALGTLIELKEKWKK